VGSIGPWLMCLPLLSVIEPPLKETHNLRTLREEVANSLTHGFGLALSLAGLPVLIWLAVRHGTAWHIVSCSIYGATLVLLYASSTLYHSLRAPAAKRVFRIFDHSAIFLLIAGTYTPFTLVTLRGPWGWSLFGAVWGLCVVGIVLKAVAAQRFRVASLLLYVAMGWMGIIAIQPLLLLAGKWGLALLLAGGVAYTAGLIFFALETILPYSHAIWHLFVLAGSACHYLAVVLIVLLPKR
jgi:hemolysin III